MKYTQFRDLQIGDRVRIPKKASKFDGGVICRVTHIDRMNGLIEGEPVGNCILRSPIFDLRQSRRAHFNQWELVNPTQRDPDYMCMDIEEVIDAS